MLILSLVLFGCGGGSECGPGTHDEDGVCVPGDGDTDGDTDGDDLPEQAMVCDDGVAPFADLQQAIDAAADGDEVTVCAGHWGRVEWAGKAISLRGTEGPALTWLEGDADHPALTVRAADGGTISGITLTGDGAALISAASIADSTLTLRDVHVTGIVSSRSVDRWGVLVDDGAVTVEDTEWFGNFDVARLLHFDEGAHSVVHSRFHDNGGIAFLAQAFDSCTLQMTNNLIYDNNDGEAIGWGVTAEANATGRFAHNTFSGNGFLVDAIAANGVDFDNNLSDKPLGNNAFALDNTDADYNLAFCPSCSWGALANNNPGEGNFIADPQLADPAGGDLHLGAGSPAIDAGFGPDDADGSAPDIGAYGGPDPFPG